MKQPRLFEPAIEIPEELRPAVELWLAYKREQWHFNYKTVALSGLVERLARFEAEGLAEGLGPGEALRAVRFSIQAPYKGVFREPVTFAKLREAKALHELRAPGMRSEPPVFDVAARVAALASAIPTDRIGELTPPGSLTLIDIAAKISRLSGEPQDVESALAALDGEMLDVAREHLNGAEEEINHSVEKTLELLRGRLPSDEIQAHRERLFWQVLRRQLNLPTLSLFSPEAEP